MPKCIIPLPSPCVKPSSSSLEAKSITGGLGDLRNVSMQAARKTLPDLAVFNCDPRGWESCDRILLGGGLLKLKIVRQHLSSKAASVPFDFHVLVKKYQGTLSFPPHFGGKGISKDVLYRSSIAISKLSVSIGAKLLYSFRC